MIDITKLQYLPTEIPGAQFLPLDFPISFTDRLSGRLDFFRVVESGVEISSSDPNVPLAQFVVRPEYGRQRYYGFTFQEKISEDPDIFGARACLVGISPVADKLPPDSLVRSRPEVQEVLKRIVALRTELVPMGFNDRILRQVIWPSFEEDAMTHFSDYEFAELWGKIWQKAIITDGEYVIERDENGEGAWSIVKNFTYYALKQTGIVVVTLEASADDVARLLLELIPCS